MDNTWLRDFQYTKSMQKRIKTLLSMVPLKEYGSLMDLGCGLQKARKYIPKKMHYVPVDIYNHCPTTFICDFNKGEFPDRNVDVILCSGVIEYIYDVDSFVRNITSRSEVVVGSYNFVESFHDRPPIWVNRLTISDLVSLFYKYGFCLVEMRLGEQKDRKIWDSKITPFDHDHYFVFTKQPDLTPEVKG